jgi:hypothetical protein
MTTPSMVLLPRGTIASDVLLLLLLLLLSPGAASSRRKGTMLLLLLLRGGRDTGEGYKAEGAGGNKHTWWVQ